MTKWPNGQMAKWPKGAIEGVKVHKVIPRPTARSAVGKNIKALRRSLDQYEQCILCILCNLWFLWILYILYILCIRCFLWPGCCVVHLLSEGVPSREDASTSWPSSSGLRHHRRTYLTILKSADHALFKMVRYVLLRPLRPELGG
jgi:hypothetical protein